MFPFILLNVQAFYVCIQWDEKLVTSSGEDPESFLPDPAQREKTPDPDMDPTWIQIEKKEEKNIKIYKNI